MKRLILAGALLTFSNCALAENYSGVWQDINGQFHSIHQKGDLLLMAKLNTTHHENSPYEQGSLFVTHNPLDLAINGSGFFTLIDNGNNYLFTRRGKFFLNKDGYIVDQANQKLLTLYDRPLPNGTQELIITEDGAITLKVASSEGFQYHDQLMLAWIPQTAIQFSGYPITTTDADKVTFFKPDEPADDHFGASIMQGTIEAVNYEEKTWSAFQGSIENNIATFSEVDEGGNTRTFQLTFETTKNATVSYENDFLIPLTATMEEIASSNNDQLMQYMHSPKERINGPLIKVF